jgi:cytochrome c553
VKANPSLNNLGAVFATALALLFTATPAAMAEGSVEAGKAKSLTCAACHGADGNSLNPEWPNIAGQHESYFESTIRSYRDGTRDNVLMTGQAMMLSDEDIADLAAYYAAQTPAEQTADPSMVRTGERLYRGGNMATGVSACIACHGPGGKGNLPAAYPALAGQHATYTQMQLVAYADESRKSDQNQMMRNIAVRLTADEMAAVASYIQGLR